MNKTSRKAVEYIVVYGNVKTMSEKVTELLKEGYGLYGTLTTDGDGDLVQALVKYEEEK